MPRLLLGALLLAVAATASGDCLLPHWSLASELLRDAGGVRAADLNGDGKSDVIGYTSANVFVALTTGAGVMGTPADVYTGTILGPLLTGDFNADDKIDLAFGSTNALIVLPGAGDGTFGAPLNTALTLTPTNATAAMLDAGTSLDLLVYDAILAVMVPFFNDGMGHFAEGAHRVIAANAAAFVAGDFDGDAQTDAVVGYDTADYDLFRAAGGGTFADPEIVRATLPVIALRAADMDGSGLPDVVLATGYGRVATLRNLGSRTFSDPIGYWSDAAELFDVEAADLSGDGVPDLATLGSPCTFQTWIGTGLGTMRYSWRNDIDRANTWCYFVDAGDLATGDFDADGRNDVLVLAARASTPTRLRLYRNRCGDSTITATAAAPVISAGTNAIVDVVVSPPDFETVMSGTFGAAGNVTIKENGTSLATGTFAFSRASVTVGGLAVGTHQLVAANEGDDQYEPNESAPVTINVTNDTTTTALTVDPLSTQYGRPPKVSATVTATNGQPITGEIRVKIDGSQVYAERTGATVKVWEAYIPYTVGTHDVTAEFLGDAVQPPSKASGSYAVSKQTPSPALSVQSAVAGQTTPVNLLVEHLGGDHPTGTVTLATDSTSLGTQALASWWPFAPYTLPAFPAGRYFLTATYSGDANYNAVEARLPLNVFSNAGEFIDARGTAAHVAVTWKTDKLIIRRKAVNESWPGSGGSCCPSQPWLDTFTQAETVYLYRMEGHGGGWTEADVGMRISFSDDPLVRGTTIKALHFQEIVRAANILRTAANLSQISAAPFAAGNTIDAAPLISLRTAINEARVALGAAAYPFTATIAASLPVGWNDIQELREAVR